jgi:hypothetical protein
MISDDEWWAIWPSKVLTGSLSWIVESPCLITLGPGPGEDGDGSRIATWGQCGHDPGRPMGNVKSKVSLNVRFCGHPNLCCKDCLERQKKDDVGEARLAATFRRPLDECLCSVPADSSQRDHPSVRYRRSVILHFHIEKHLRYRLSRCLYSTLTPYSLHVQNKNHAAVMRLR